MSWESASRKMMICIIVHLSLIIKIENCTGGWIHCWRKEKKLMRKWEGSNWRNKGQRSDLSPWTGTWRESLRQRKCHQKRLTTWKISSSISSPWMPTWETVWTRKDARQSNSSTQPTTNSHHSNKTSRRRNNTFTNWNGRILNWWRKSGTGKGNSKQKRNSSTVWKRHPVSTRRRSSYQKVKRASFCCKMQH